MADERAFIARVEAADPAEFADLLLRMSGEEGRILRTHFGDARLQRMRNLALQAGARGAANAGRRGNVVVIPGVLGSELATFDANGDRDLLWVAFLRLVRGQIDRLRLSDDGLSEIGGALQVSPIGIMKAYYGELLLSLSRGWNVQAFFYDWRKDLSIVADELHAQITGWFGDDTPVHLVAHSLGGLVARTFIRRHPDRWRRMQDRNGVRGGRLIMLGTPNRGAFATVQTMVGVDSLIRILAKLDLQHDEQELAQITNSFVSLYQMLPTADGDATLDELYKARTYSGFGVSQRHLEAARRFQAELAKPIAQPERLIYIAGANRATLSALPDAALPDNPDRLRQPDAYGASDDGDGRVLHDRGKWRIAAPGSPEDGRELPDPGNWYFVDAAHADLPANLLVRAALDDLLASGGTKQLSDRKPASRGQNGHAIERYVASQQAVEAQADSLAQQLPRARSVRGTVFLTARSPDQAASNQAAAPAIPTSVEATLRDLLVRGSIAEPGAREPDERRAEGPRPHIEIRLVFGEIEALDRADLAAQPPVDAIAVGHYLGVRPQAAELALDRAISQAEAAGGKALLPPDDFILTQFTDRQTFAGELGRPFFLTDPRVADGVGRVIAIIGLGAPGRLGPPELTVAVRELCWSLGRIGKRNLATVLIGAGNGNIPPRDAVRAWVRGIELAVSGWSDANAKKLSRITFVVHKQETMDLVHQALIDEKARLDQARQLEIDYERAGDDAAARLTRDGQTGEQPQPAGAMTRGADNGKPGDDKPDLAPTRLTLALESDQYRFGAITADAAVPERVVSIDPSLVMKANDELAQEGDPDLQAERGIFLERLLLPRELQPYLATSAPLVMLLDPRTARVHWEMVAQPDPDEVMRGADGDAPSGEIPRAFDPYRFLGTARGLTRQLRTTFTAPPEPPPPPRRRLRVLVVADPADDASLPGAELEGGIVADLFEAFNTFPDRDRAAGDNVVEVTRLFGPTEATLTNVLRELMIRTYDVFHFAGHCFYNPNDPLGSGYIFHLDPLECLTAHELNRIDRIPKFVFSNACESGVTQDRIDLRSIDLPPSFAEAFFGRGVANFVCTAWPVDDLAARQFATTLYAGMLGLTIDADGRAIGSAEPLPIYRALRDARVAIAATPNGAQTWGAYQHYGNPFFRFFARLPASVPPAAAPHRRARPLPERHERGEAAAASAAGASPQVNDA